MNNNSILRRRFTYKYYNAAFILIGINVLIFIISSISPVSRAFLSMNPVLVTRQGYIWQVFTYMFAHANLSHILFNMLGLFFFGVQIERHMGSSEFLLYYLGTGTLAGLFSLVVYLLTGQYQVWLLGASGAIFAVLLAFATYFPQARIFLFGIIPIRAPVLVIGYTLIELFSQFFSARSGVAHLTHLAGFGFGYLYFLIREGINPIKVFMDSSRRY
ncbi:MAG: rhomboid family intramembrane serine protease [Spirochaetia bacterium]